MERRLTAILAIDVVEYSRLMRKDEEGTLACLIETRQLIDRLALEHGGRTFGAAGDSILAEFSSPVEAVRCSFNIQHNITEANANRSEDAQMQLRIGVNLGDVMDENGTLYGDGINVAARLESMSEARGMCISGAIYEHVRDRVDLTFRDIGMHEVKNISRPIRVYTWSPSTADEMTHESIEIVSDKPSIAVLPFENMSGDPEDRLICEGLAEDVATALSKIDRLFVVAHSSTANYGSQQVDLENVRREQGVRYILKGSLRRSGRRVRMTVHLTDTDSGRQTFAERYDRELSDIFELQDEITREITTSLQIKLTDGEQAQLWAGGTQNFEAWQLCFQAAELIDRHAREDTASSLKLLERAVKIDPNYATAWCKIGWAHWANGRHHWVRDVPNAYKKAREVGLRVLEIDRDYAEAYSLLAMTAMQEGDYDEAQRMAEEGAERATGQAFVLATLAFVIVHSGRASLAVGLCKKAMALSPIYPNWYRVTLGRAYYLAGDLGPAIEWLRAWYEHDPEGVNPILLAAALYDDGQEDSASRVCRELIRNSPDLTIAEWARDQSYRDPRIVEHLSTVVRKLGLPD